MKNAKNNYNKAMRKLDETYICYPGDKISSINNGTIIVESLDGEQTEMMIEEFVVKDIRSKILSEANNNQFDPVEVLKMMGISALRPYNGMPFNKFIIANLIPGADMDAIMGNTGDYAVLISACVGDDQIKSLLTEIKKELKKEDIEPKYLTRIRTDIQNRILDIAQRMNAQNQSEQIQESIDMLNESLTIAVGVGIGACVGVLVGKAIAGIARWIKNRKADKQYKKVQMEQRHRGDTYIDTDGGPSDSFMININSSTGTTKHKHTAIGLPFYRSGKKKSLDDFLKELERVTAFDKEMMVFKGDYATAITVYDSSEIRKTFFEYEFNRGVNRYYLIGEDDLHNGVCFCPTAADCLYLIDFEDVLPTTDIPGLKRFQMSAASMTPGYAIARIDELPYNKITIYDEVAEKDVEVKI